MEESYDCIVVGGGPAGLSAALLLARYKRRALTFHHNSPRNGCSTGMHGFLGHHGILPFKLLELGRKEIIDHGGVVREGCVTAVERIDAHCFRVQTECGEGPFIARRVILATGLRDIAPCCESFSQFSGVSIHKCPECDGYEISNKRVAVLGHGRKAVGTALDLLTWTDRLTVVIASGRDEISDEVREKILLSKMRLVEGNVTKIEGDCQTKQLTSVQLDCGESIDCDALFFNFGSELSSKLHTQLGCDTDEDGLILVDQNQQTTVPGVYAAGDITPKTPLAIAAREGHYGGHSPA